MAIIEEKEGALTLRVLIQPRASREEIVGPKGDALKIRLTSPPVEGAANKQCMALLSRVLGVPKTSIEIIEGSKSRRKRLKIYGISRKVLEKSLRL